MAVVEHRIASPVLVQSLGHNTGLDGSSNVPDSFRNRDEENEKVDSE